MPTVFDSKTKIWSGPKLLDDIHTNAAEKCLSLLMKDPNHIAQICHTSGKEYTNREIAEMSIRVAQHFRDNMKFSQGEAIGLCAANSEYVVPLFFGCLLAGLTISPVEPRLERDAIKHVYSLTKPSIIFCDGNVYELIKNVAEELELKTTICTMKSHLPNVPSILEFLQTPTNLNTFRADALKEGRNQTAMFLFSSGTTGQPKAVRVSHAALLNIHRKGHHIQSAICLHAIHWVSGVVQVFFCATQNVTNVISDRPFSTTDFFDIVEKYKIESIIAPPYLLSLLVADPQIKSSDLSSLKEICSAGSSTPNSLLQNIKRSFPKATILVAYGSTEALGISGGLATTEKYVGSLGTNKQVKIVDEASKLLGPNEQGEICVRNPYPWAGYHNDSESTATAYIDGWIHTGDMGYFDDENNLYITGRIKEILKCEGYQVFPSEIETIIYKLSGVSETCVFGIPDSLRTNLLAAAVVLTPGSHLKEKEIIDFVAAQTAEFKQLSGGVYFLDALPRTTTWKVKREHVFHICNKLR